MHTPLFLNTIEKDFKCLSVMSETHFAYKTILIFSMEGTYMSFDILGFKYSTESTTVAKKSADG
jgi:hypothetical protein